MQQYINTYESSGYTFLGLFSGAGGLDLGFEFAQKIAVKVRQALEMLDKKTTHSLEYGEQISLF